MRHNRRYRRAQLLVFGLILFVAGAWELSAQMVTKKEHRREGSELRTMDLIQLPTARLASFDVDSTRIAMEESSAELRSYHFAHTLPLRVDLIREGAHSVWNDGTEVWRYRVQSTGALSLGFFFSRFVLPKGAYVYVYATTQPEYYIGGFGAENNNVNGSLPLQPIASDDVVIELQAPKGSRPELVLEEVYHGVRPLPLLRAIHPQYGVPASFTCAPELACYPEYFEMGRGVVFCLLGGEVLGTGTLVNNTANDGRALILTAAHVVSNSFGTTAIYQQAEKGIYFFNYQTPMCDSSVQPSVQQSIAGSTLLGYHPFTDVAVLELSHKPPLAYQPIYVGWNAQPNLSQNYFNVHHPTGYTKRVNLTFSPLSYVSFPTASYPFGKNQHLMVSRWDVGTTAGGSSGSPLFDVEQRIIGVLSGGNSQCGNTLSDYFGSLQRVWENQDKEARKIVEALDPIAKGGTTECQPSRVGAEGGKLPQRITHMAVPPSTEPLHNLLPQLDREALLGTASGVEEVAESYRMKADTKIYGAYLMLTGVARKDEKLELKLYGNEGKSQLATVQVPLDDLDVKKYFDDGNGRFRVSPKVEKPITDEVRRKTVANRFQELFVSFPTPIDISSEQVVYFAISTPSIPKELSLAHQQWEQPEYHSLVWKKSGVWKGASTPSSVALWIDPVVSRPAIENPTPNTPQMSLTPLADNRLKLTIMGIDESSQKNLNVYTLLGQRLLSYSFVGNTILLDRHNFEGVGLLVIHVEGDGWSESIKAYFPKHK